MSSNKKVVLITGAARRIGAVVARVLHAKGFDIALHYRNSAADAKKLAHELLQKRAQSVFLLHADLGAPAVCEDLVARCVAHYGRLDVLIHNASSFFATNIGTVTAAEWDDLFNSNARAPFFLSQAAVPHLMQQGGCIINILDIHAVKPMKAHTVYCMAKAGLAMLTKSLALELAPEIRVNGIAPGAIMWPELDNALGDERKQKIIAHIPLQCTGTPEDIAKAVYFLIADAPHITGQILAVDGGRSLSF